MSHQHERWRPTTARAHPNAPTERGLRGHALPPGWYLAELRLDGAAYRSHRTALMVIESIGVERDGKRWHHVSLSYPSCLPRYEDLLLVKRHWVGEEATALQVFPPAAQHVNSHPFCLHLWSCLDGDVTPDFRGPGGTI